MKIYLCRLCRPFFCLLLCSAVLPPPASGQSTQLPATGVWNGFLGQENILECSNPGTVTASLVLTIADYTGAVHGTVPFTLGPKTTKHIPLSAYSIVDSYGSLLLDAAANRDTVRISCIVAFYRFAGTGAVKAVEYAYAMPLLSPLTGTTAGVFNSYSPALDDRPVYNFLSIYNPGSQPFSAGVEVYRQDGTLNTERSFRIEALAGAGRRDFALGHEEGQVVGIYRIVPDDTSQQYGAFLTRYSLGGTGGYRFAFPLLAAEGQCSPGPIPASTMDPAVNWGEVANPTNQPIEVRIRIINRTGAALLDEVRTIAPFSQHHTPINAYLGERNVGTFEASCTSANPQHKLLVQSLYYGRTGSAGAAVEWAYASQALGSVTGAGTAVVASLNTFLGAANWQKLLDAGASGAALDLEAYREDAVLSGHEEHQIAPGGSIDVPLHQTVGANFIGIGVFTPRAPSALYPELLRVFPHRSASIGYIMNIPSTAIEAPPSNERQRVLNDYYANYLGSAVGWNELGWTGSTGSCSAGTISDQAQTKVLQRINYYRRQVGLADDITLDNTKNAKSQQAALMMSANSSLSHSPPASWRCYTAEGAEAAGKSNLALGYHSSDAIEAYIEDFGANNRAVGHRRWILYSRAQVMGHGSTGNAQALWVIGDFRSAPAQLPEFIAWPPAGYVPSPLVPGRWSFSIPGASFSSSQVTMTDAHGVPLTLSLLPVANGYGDNTLVWEPQGVTAGAADTVYHVAVNNVVVNSAARNYSYDVIIVQPASAARPLLDDYSPQLGEAIKLDNLE